MNNLYMVATSRQRWCGLTEQQMKRKVECLKELCIPYEVYLECVIKKIAYYRVK